jgi:drug/metabolite transporter (DMT)-like permease
VGKTGATLIGFTAVLMWAILALLSAGSSTVPPFQLTAMTFLIGGSLGALSWAFRPGAARALKQRWQVWALGVIGLFGYHFVYYSAIRAAPAVEVSLIAYLWPLFIVVLSSFLQGEKLKPHHVIGVLCGLAGAVLVISRGNFSSLLAQFSYGHLLAFACAFIWSGYSVLSRLVGKVSTDVVAGFCLVTSFLAFLCHLAFETTVWPETITQWLAILGLGLLPVGAAFYTWDYGVKHGDIMVLGAASYASPVLSVLVLVLAGRAPFTWAVIAACGLITAGAIIAAKDMIFRKPAAESESAT